MAQTNNLTPEQKAAHNLAVKTYCLKRAAELNIPLQNNPVFVIPEFEEDNGEWIPIESNGVRISKKVNPVTGKLSSFMHLGSITRVITGGKPQWKPRFINLFEDEAGNLAMDIVAYGLSVGSLYPGIALIKQESLTPFSLKNPERDIKVAGNSGITCTFQGVDAQGIVYDEPAPIYSRTRIAESGTPDTTITHTNTAEIQAWAAADRAKNANANKNIRGGNRLAELQAIPKAKRTAAEKAELAELMD